MSTIRDLFIRQKPTVRVFFSIKKITINNRTVESLIAQTERECVEQNWGQNEQRRPDTRQ